MNSFTSLRKRFLIATIATMTAIAIPIPASADGETSKTQQCLMTITGKDASNMFKTTAEKCFNSYAEVLRAAGGENIADDITPAEAKNNGVFALLSIIGVHFDANNGTGSSLTVNGSTCVGGGLNVPLAWNDRISSTLNGCPSIVHYENSNYVGSSIITYGSGSLTSLSGAYMDNRTSSILYY
jgi:hypothetical protein